MMDWQSPRVELQDDDPVMDRGVLAGWGIALVLVGLGVVLSGRALGYLDPAGLALVGGGTFGAALIHFSWEDMRRAWLEFRRVLFAEERNPADRILYLIGLAGAVRDHGLLTLDRESRRSRDPFLQLALELAAEGEEIQDLARILETELRTADDRSGRAVQLFQTMGGYSPAMGLIGTLIGLIQMLGNLNDTASIGPAMSLALVATLYGAVLSNFIFLPIAGKIRTRADEDALVKAITIEGVVSLARQESPVVLEQRLRMFMPGHGVAQE
jgi:chemotaxis protein MotA